jgi:hypothetical protein
MGFVVAGNIRPSPLVPQRVAVTRFGTLPDGLTVFAASPEFQLNG